MVVAVSRYMFDQFVSARNCRTDRVVHKELGQGADICPWLSSTRVKDSTGEGRLRICTS